jgi:hypothetical protein
MDGISSTRSSLAFWGGALGPQLVHRAAARALDGEANVVAHADLRLQLPQRISCIFVVPAMC